ncbi:MAG TPA: hypothetical protein PK846_10595, partial [Spirochaetota bacterium]|nr:hypothetical protein [Spirochaetota bacterium]
FTRLIQPIKIPVWVKRNILNANQKIGNVMPDGILSDNIKILINSEESELLGIFIGWLVFFSWLYTYQFA